MKRIEVKLSLPVVAPLLDLMKGVSDELSGALAAPLKITDVEPEFVAAWSADLLDGQTGDLRSLLDLFDEKFFAEGVVGFDEDNAESVLRACAALRLRLRSHHLKTLGEEALESGEVEMESLTPPDQKAFMCYLFLATLQELIIQHLEY